MAKKKAKDLTPKRKDVKGGGMGRDVDRITRRDVGRVNKGIQEAGRSLRKGVRAIPK